MSEQKQKRQQEIRMVEAKEEARIQRQRVVLWISIVATLLVATYAVYQLS